MIEKRIGPGEREDLDADAVAPRIGSQGDV